MQAYSAAIVHIVSAALVLLSFAAASVVPVAE
jgi:hypothetical protein